jgi:hypothetical protein
MGHLQPRRETQRRLNLLRPSLARASNSLLEVSSSYRLLDNKHAYGIEEVSIRFLYSRSAFFQ